MMEDSPFSPRSRCARSPPPTPVAGPAPPPQAPQQKNKAFEAITTSDIQSWMTTIDQNLQEVCNIAAEGKLNMDQKMRLNALCRKIGHSTSQMAVQYQYMKAKAFQYLNVAKALETQLDLSQQLKELKLCVEEKTKPALGASFADMVKKGANNYIQPTNARAALDAMLVKLCAECSLAELRASLVDACVQSAPHADSSALAALEQLLARACARRPDLLTVLLPYIKEAGEAGGPPRDLKCVLMLLRVCRKSAAAAALAHSSDAEWKGVISYELLKQAAVDAVDESAAAAALAHSSDAEWKGVISYELLKQAAVDAVDEVMRSKMCLNATARVSQVRCSRRAGALQRRRVEGRHQLRAAQASRCGRRRRGNAI
ncbi:hypothetical protein PYW07_012470 [Mythimna separata]|uniref:Uncharacterized protein n=1 Tax=Mythimna separata TaxID=271217 RepID=A0AAD7YL91_MYTSE|nr:hypothetical protein PYW07_012470 [Mythimna separata]